MFSIPVKKFFQIPSLFCLLLFSFLVLTAVDCRGNPAGSAKKEGLPEEPKNPAPERNAQTMPAQEEVAVIETNLGKIVLGFYPDVAPQHVQNFKDLAAKEFYNGTKFHRVIPGFMIQGGDPNSRSDDRSQHGMGGSGKKLKAEFNQKPHLRGTLSMARSSHPDSASSQFFICVADAAQLDGKYTVFGHVIEGMDVADKIVNTPRDARDNPLQPVVLKSVKIEKRASK
jgi:peptidyl-prolyl cis-trans isomerase B (cyclophilin B)